MSSLMVLTCPACSGKLQITPEIDRFACGYCGTEFVVNRGGGIVSLAPVVESLHRVERGVDRTASELAIVRLQKDIAQLGEQRRTINAQSSDSIFVVGTILALSAIASAFNSAVGWGAVLGIMAIFLFVTASKSESAKGKKLAAVDAQIAAKIVELQKHQATVAR